MNKKEFRLPAIASAKAEDQPATRKMLNLVCQELKSEMRSVGLKIESSMDSKLAAMESRTDTRFKDMESRTDTRFKDMESRTDTRFKDMESRMDTRFKESDTRLSNLETQVGFLNADFKGMRADIEEIKANNHRMLLLLEEQNANNRIVLEGLQGLGQRQDRLEKAFASRI